MASLKKRLRNFLFDLTAPLYDRIIGENASIDVPIYRGGYTLDLGGGTGRVTRELENVIVVDVSFQMLRQSIKRGKFAVRAEAESLPFRDNAFAQIVIVDALHHFLDQKSALQEAFRVLEPDGSIYIEEPNIDTFPVKVVALLERMALMGSRFFSKKDIVSLAEELGFDVSSEETEPYYIRLTLKKPL